MPAPIFWIDNSAGTYTGGVEFLHIFGGSGGNTFSVKGEGNLAGGTDIDSGSGSNTVNVYATTGPLFLDSDSGFQSVDVGMGSTASIFGYVNVGSDFLDSGTSYLYVDDSSDTTGRTANLYDGELTGLGSPAPIYWTPGSSTTGGVTYVAVGGGWGATPSTSTTPATSKTRRTCLLAAARTPSTSTPRPALYVDGVLGFDSVDVGMGSTAGISGLINVFSGGHSNLRVDDSADTTGRTANLYDGELTGLGASAPIYWNPTSTATGGVTYVAVDGGSGGNTLNVENTSNLYDYTVLSPGIGSNTVNVYGTTGAAVRRRRRRLRFSGCGRGLDRRHPWLCQRQQHQRL